LQHFERLGKVGTVTFTCLPPAANKYIVIGISDNVPEPGAVKRVNDILDDPDSQRTLRRLVKPIVERQLQGKIWAERNREFDSVVIHVEIPITASAH
jgi:hypothetical protein